jgi:hypothetical protein
MKLKLDYKDFLCDDLFVYWRTRRTVKLTQFWEDFINKNEHLRESFELAIATFDEIQKNKSECIIDEETVNRQLQDRIYHLKKRKQLSIIVTSVAASLFITIISTIYILTSNTNSVPENQLTSIGEVMSQDKIQLISGEQSFDIENNSMVQLTEGENALIHDSITQKQIDLKNNQNKHISSCCFDRIITIYISNCTMREEDPTWIVEISKELKQTIVSGQGEFHLKTLKWRIENNDKIEIEFLEPKIPYRETITKAARADYRHKKQSGGAGQFGEVHLIIEPYTEGMPLPEIYKFNGQEFKIQNRDTQVINLDWGGKLVFVNSIVGGSIDARFMPAILKGIMGRMEQGPLTGSYARDVRVIVYDGKMHPVDSNEISFMLAGRNAFSTAFKNASPKILEPIYNVTVSVPGDYMGDVMSDLQGRRAIIMGMESEKGFEKLNAKVPLKEMNTYSTSLSSITGGRGSFSMKFASYELVPSDVQEKLLKEYEEQEKED